MPKMVNNNKNYYNINQAEYTLNALQNEWLSNCNVTFLAIYVMFSELNLVISFVYSISIIWSV